MRVPVIRFAVALSMLLPLSGCQNGSGWSLDSFAFWKTKPRDPALASRGALPRPSSRATPTGMGNQPGYAQASASTPRVRVTSGVADATYNTQAGYGQGYGTGQTYSGTQTGAGIPAQAGRWDPNGASSYAARTASTSSTYQQYNRATAGSGNDYSGYSGATPNYRGTAVPGYSAASGYGSRSSAAGGYPNTSVATAGRAYPQNTSGGSYDYRSDATQRGSYPFGSPGGVAYRSDSTYPSSRSQTAGTQAGPSSVYPAAGAAGGYPSGTQNPAAGGYPSTSGNYSASATGYSPSGGYQPPGYQSQKGGYTPGAGTGGYASPDYQQSNGGYSQSPSGQTRLTDLDPSQEYRPGHTSTYNMSPSSQPSSVTNPYATGYPGTTTAGLPDSNSMR